MPEFLESLFDPSGFPPRWQCGAWTAAHGWLHVLSDLGVWSAYVAIPCVLGFFVLRRKDIPFRLIFVLFGAFILACGTTHLMEAILFWWPAYRLAGAIKLFTALVSWGTVLALVRVAPRALAMRSPEELEREIEERRRLEGERRLAQAALEKQVEARTAELALANEGLRREVEQRCRAEERLEHQVEQRTAELLQTNERLQRSEAMFQVLFQFAPDAIIVAGTDGRIQYANLQTEKMFGHSRDELLGQPVEALIPERYHESHRRHRAQYSATPRTRPMGEGRELYGRRKDGREFPVDVLLAPLETPDGLLLLSNVRDISHRKVNQDIIKARARQQASLAEFGQRALESYDLAVLLDEAVTAIARTLGADLCWLAERAPGGEKMALRAVWGGKPESIGQPLFDSGAGSQAGCCLLAGQPVVVADLRSETRFTPSAYLLEHGAVSGTCVAVRGKAGAHGVLGAYTRRPHPFTAEDVVFLQVFANMLGVLLDRTKAERQVHASLAEKEVLLKEIHHRVKNNLQVISSLLDLQSQHTTDGTLVEMFRESQNRVRSMALVHERLYRSFDLARVDFAGYLDRLTDDLFQSYRVDTEAVRLDLQTHGDARLPIDAAVPCGLLVNELVSNCLKHAFAGRPGGVIRVGLCPAADNHLHLTVADDGVGLPDGVDLQRADTFGLQLVAMLVDQLKGTVAIDRAGGTAFRIAFPIPKAERGRG
jgi:PAS domain S-box-containing protein